MKPKAITMHVLPLLWALLVKAAPGSNPAEPGTVRYSTIQLAQTLDNKLGNTLFEQARNTSSVNPRMQLILADMLKIELA